MTSGTFINDAASTNYSATKKYLYLFGQITYIRGL